MAYTKVSSTKNLRKSINYSCNSSKTDPAKQGIEIEQLVNLSRDKKNTRTRIFCYGINCNPETAYEEMMQTKRRWKKLNGRSGYSIIQSFRAGEISAEMAFEIGKEFADRLLGDKYEVVVSTHLDRAHYHNHIVFNSVSFVDGEKYRNSFGDYYNGIRKISDEICREHNLSVIRPRGKGVHYTEWQAEQSGIKTIRGMIKQELDDVLKRSFTFQDFMSELKKRGYKIKQGANVKHMAIKPPNAKRYIRLSSLRDENYTESGIKDRLLTQRMTGEYSPPKKRRVRGRKKYRYKGLYRNLKKINMHGYIALYFRYVYMLRKVRRKRAPKKLQRENMMEVRNFKKYVQLHNFVRDNNIRTQEELLELKQKSEARISQLTTERIPLYNERKQTNEVSEKESVSKKIAQINEELKAQRQILRLCVKVESTAPHLQKRLKKTRKKETEQQLIQPKQSTRKEVKRNDYVK